MSIKDIVAEVREHFEKGDLIGGLRALNSKTPHRFTAMYLVANDFCQNMYGVDKTDPALTLLPDVPGTASYCAFTTRRARPFVFEDATLVPELNGHPAQHEVRSYCAVPLVDVEGNIIGTVCHFDYDVIPISDETVHLMEEVAELLGHLPKSLYADRANRVLSTDSTGFKAGMVAQ